jgi:peptide/nickel transport system substrate-binding protein
MKKWFVVFIVTVSMVVLLCPYSPQAAGTNKAVTPSMKVKTSSGATAGSTAEKTQTGGIWKILMTRSPVVFGYPPKIAGPDKDFAPPLFERLVAVGDRGRYKPQLATSWNMTTDGKSITFKLRQGVKFHDGSDFNAQAVKFNFDALIPPNPVLLNGVTSVEAVDPYTVRVNLSDYNNLIFYQMASDAGCYIASPTAIQKNGVDWAGTHPVGTGPFKFESYEPNSVLTLTKNPDYWEKGLPYLDKIQINIVPDAMTQLLSFKAGQADAIYDATPSGSAQLRDLGWPLLTATGALFSLSFDTKNSKILRDVRVRKAIEYAIDKEAICSGPGYGLYKPVYQVVNTASPSYNRTCPPRKYDPQKAIALLREAGYPNGFSFKATFLDSYWRDGIVAVQAYLAKAGINMDVNLVNSSAYSKIRLNGQIEPGTAAMLTMNSFSNSLFNMDAYFRSNTPQYQYVVRPKGIDDLIDKAKSLRDQDSVIPVTREISKLMYDDETVVPLWMNPRIVVLGKPVRNAGWFINGDAYLNEYGRSTWLKK